MEYREEMEHIEDTTCMRKGLMFAQLMKKYYFLGISLFSAIILLSGVIII